MYDQMLCILIKAVMKVIVKMMNLIKHQTCIYSMVIELLLQHPLTVFSSRMARGGVGGVSCSNMILFLSSFQGPEYIQEKS